MTGPTTFEGEAWDEPTATTPRRRMADHPDPIVANLGRLARDRKEDAHTYMNYRDALFLKGFDHTSPDVRDTVHQAAAANAQHAAYQHAGHVVCDALNAREANARTTTTESEGIMPAPVPAKFTITIRGEITNPDGTPPDAAAAETVIALLAGFATAQVEDPDWVAFGDHDPAVERMTVANVTTAFTGLTPNWQVRS